MTFIVGEQVCRFMMDDVVPTDIIRIAHKNREVAFRTTVIDGTIVLQLAIINIKSPIKSIFKETLDEKVEEAVAV